MNKIYGEIAVVTPEEAQNILNTRNTVNRPIDKRQVARYAASMKAGAWRINGECLVFAPDGTLLDGQNRLAAVVKAGVSVAFCVWYNVPEDARSSMDSGKKRTAADVLHFKGYRNANIMAPIVRMAYVYDMLDRKMNLSGKAHEVNTDIIARYAEYLNPDVAESTGDSDQKATVCVPSGLVFTVSCSTVLAIGSSSFLCRFPLSASGTPRRRFLSPLPRYRQGQDALSGKPM